MQPFLEVQRQQKFHKPVIEKAILSSSQSVQTRQQTRVWLPNLQLVTAPKCRQIP